MVHKLEKWELGYALAILDFISRNSSMAKKELADKFSTTILVWLAENDLIIFSTLSIEGEALEVRAGLGKRARALDNIDEGIMRIDILDSINNAL